MLISLGNFGKAFLIWKTYIYKRTKRTELQEFQELHDKNV